MKKPSQELVDAFIKWYATDPHSKNEDYYITTIAQDHLTGLSKSEFIDFFYNFANEGGRVQSGGHRTSKKFRQTIEQSYDQFRSYILRPFMAEFDELEWLDQAKFKYFGIGLATIFLNRIDKKRFSILNKKTGDSLYLFNITLPSNRVKAYQVVRKAQLQLIDWFPEIENFFRADALNQFLIGEKDGEKWKKTLSDNADAGPDDTLKKYWLYAPGRDAKFWEECLQKNIMVYGADSLDELTSYKSKEAIEEALKQTLKKKVRPKNDALAAWEFSHVIKPGDIIIAKKGSRQYVGYGVVTGNYSYDSSRQTYRNVRPTKWVKSGNWDEPGPGKIVQKTLTDITDDPDYVAKLKKLIGIENNPGQHARPMKALNTILYGPPGTGKTYLLKNEYMKQFTEYQTLSPEQFAREIVADLTWLQVISMVLYDIGSTKVTAIFDHPLLQAKISLQANQNPKNTIWAWLQRHTKLDCPNVKHTQRDEPLIFWKDENSIWAVDREMLEEQLPELIDRLKTFKEFKPTEKEIKRYEYVTFHQSYCYEDFVEGIKPVMSENADETLTYEIKPGIFKNMVKMALEDPTHSHALLIDEINRGNVANIFGELISLIEEDKRKDAGNELRVKLPYSRQEFVVPQNLYIIGAMNTADRSIEALDTALRRRFEFLNVQPRPELIQQPLNFEVDLKELLTKINARIEKLLDVDHCIGHSYFMNFSENNNPLNELQNVFAKRIIPLLQEYFYGDPGKIGMVLGERFVVRKDDSIEWATGDWGVDDFEERRVYALQDPMQLKAEDFRSIYE